ncbi:unnamed protein product [Mytilus coruscus]|uniref:Uncharacterized protein n=1 Tax=Mytilus coruscus TaxID=42192 RepID=A0A6J8BVR4_MYTCO|nr:unnamed protein product [Mytilus coruscus]
MELVNHMAHNVTTAERTTTSPVGSAAVMLYKTNWARHTRRKGGAETMETGDDSRKTTRRSARKEKGKKKGQAWTKSLPPPKTVRSPFEKRGRNKPMGTYILMFRGTRREWNELLETINPARKEFEYCKQQLMICDFDRIKVIVEMFEGWGVDYMLIHPDPYPSAEQKARREDDKKRRRQRREVVRRLQKNRADFDALPPRGRTDHSA